MSKAAAFEKKWKKEVGKQTVNPNSVNWDEIKRDAEALKAAQQPEGSFTFTQFQKEMTLGENAARELLHKLVATGKYQVHPQKGPNGMKYYVKV